MVNDIPTEKKRVGGAAHKHVLASPNARQGFNANAGLRGGCSMRGPSLLPVSETFQEEQACVMQEGSRQTLEAAA